MLAGESRSVVVRPGSVVGHQLDAPVPRATRFFDVRCHGARVGDTEGLQALRVDLVLADELRDHGVGPLLRQLEIRRKAADVVGVARTISSLSVLLVASSLPISAMVSFDSGFTSALLESKRIPYSAIRPDVVIAATISSAVGESMVCAIAWVSTVSTMTKVRPLKFLQSPSSLDVKASTETCALLAATSSTA